MSLLYLDKFLVTSTLQVDHILVCQHWLVHIRAMSCLSMRLRWVSLASWTITSSLVDKVLHVCHALFNQLNHGFCCVTNLNEFTQSLVKKRRTAVGVANEDSLVISFSVAHQLLVEKATLPETLQQQLQLADACLQMVVLLACRLLHSDGLSALLQVRAELGRQFSRSL